MKKTLIFIVLTATIIGCNKNYDFNYYIIDFDTDIEKLPFGSNTPLEPGKAFPVVFKATDSELAASIYVVERVGGGTNVSLRSVVKYSGDTAFLSFSRHLKGSVSTSLVNKVRLDYRVMKKGIQHLYFIQPLLNELFVD